MTTTNPTLILTPEVQALLADTDIRRRVATQCARSLASAIDELRCVDGTMASSDGEERDPRLTFHDTARLVVILMAEPLDVDSWYRWVLPMCSNDDGFMGNKAPAEHFAAGSPANQAADVDAATVREIAQFLADADTSDMRGVAAEVARLWPHATAQQQRQALDASLKLIEARIEASTREVATLQLAAVFEAANGA